MNRTKCGGGYIYNVPLSDIEYIGYFYGKNGNEEIKSARTRLTKERGRAPDFLMNAELFDLKTRKAASDVVDGGVVIRLTEGYGFAFPENNRAVFSYKNNVNAPDYVGGYPTLVKDGKEIIQSPAGITGRRGRTALALSKDALLITLIPDKGGVALSELRRDLLRNGATHAINLDGGVSTQFYTPLGNYFSGRRVRGFIGIWLKNSADIRTVNVANGKSLRVRSGAGFGYKKIGNLYRGDIVTVLETKGLWCRISVGWVYSAYLKRR